MPLCEGLPSGPCPFNVNNRTVKLTQGDMMLCPKCEEARFPPVLRAGCNESHESQTTEIKGKTNTATKTKTKAATAAAAAAAAAVPTTNDGRLNNESQAAVSPNDHDCDNLYSCPSCLLTVDRSDARQIACDICLQKYHQRCTNMNAKVFDKFITVANITGWVCDICKTTARATIHKMQSALSQLAEDLATVKADLTSVLQPDNRNLNSYHDNTVSGQQADTEPGDEERFTLVVHRTLNDTNRRKRNVLVSGLPESEQDDRLAFLSMCEDILGIKPFVAENGCRRIGNSNPRKLLVRLRSNEAATDLLRAAPKLRQSTNAIYRHVYINEDLSPAAAKLAYEARQSRREKRHKQPSSRNTPTQINDAADCVQLHSAPVQTAASAIRTDVPNGATSITHTSSQPAGSGATAPTPNTTTSTGTAQPPAPEAYASNMNSFPYTSPCKQGGPHA